MCTKQKGTLFSQSVRGKRMSITSMIFLLVFLPISLIIYYIANDKAKEYVLLALSLVFYALGSVEYIILFVGAVALTVLLGRCMAYCQKKKIKVFLLILGIILNAGLLIYYKYTDFALSIFAHITLKDIQFKNLLLPLGISFFTFKAISYLVDVYKNEAELEENPLHDALYLSFFAQIQSGPLSRYNEMKAFKKNCFSEGVYRFLTGFCKKVLIADVLTNITNEVFSMPVEGYSTAYAWLGAICYSLQLYFDFAGYSDMAIGISGMFGYQCRENFNYPYMTESVSKFWKRWHISLSEWFRDYVYIPLGGSRVNSKWRIYFNLFVVWTLTGIWHGASWNFVAWGLGYFIVIAFEKLTNVPDRLKTKVGKFTYRILSLAFINFQWVLFNSADLTSGLRYIKRMFICPPNELADYRTLFLLKDYGFFIAIAIVFCFPVVPKLEKKLAGKKVIYPVAEIVKAVIIIAAFVWSISFVVAGQNNPFTYANF